MLAIASQSSVPDLLKDLQVNNNNNNYINNNSNNDNEKGSSNFISTIKRPIYTFTKIKIFATGKNYKIYKQYIFLYFYV